MCKRVCVYLFGPLADSGDTINPNRFTVHASSGQAVFYFNPCSVELPRLNRDIRLAEERKLCYSLALYPNLI